MSSLSSTLNDYWLWKEVNNKLGVSNTLYRSWKNTPSVKLNNKYVFIQKESLPSKYSYVEPILTDLSGYLPVRYASDRFNINEHTFNSKDMKLYKYFEYKYVEDIKFVNIKRFLSEHGIKIRKNDVFQLGRMSKLDITVDSTFHRISDEYGLVIYNS